MKITHGITVVVTGGASGLGEAVTRHVHARNGNVLVCDLNADRGAALVSELGADRVLFCRTDVCDDASVAAALHACQQKFGGVHVVVNCAGIAPARKVVSGRGRVHDMASFNTALQVNVCGTFNVLRLAAAMMMKQQPCGESGERGCIINVASVAAYEGQIGQAAYSASKGAVVAMTLPIARELCKHGIRCNVVAPGIMLTPMMAAMPANVQSSLAAQIPFPARLGAPAEFAALCGTVMENQYLNGTVLRIDGGIRMSSM